MANLREMRIFSADQIEVPQDLPSILKEFSKEAMTAMLDGMELFPMGYSWGGFESLMIPTFPATIRSTPAWPYQGPSIRIHAGLEDPDDLTDDLEKGLNRLSAAG